MPKTRTQQSKTYRAQQQGRDPHWEKLMHRPNGTMDPRPKRQRTRAASKRAALRDY